MICGKKPRLRCCSSLRNRVFQEQKPGFSRSVKETLWMTDPLTVDPALCRACGACVAECVHHLVVPGGKHVDPANPQCERCLHCYAVCPPSAPNKTVRHSL